MSHCQTPLMVSLVFPLSLSLSPSLPACLGLARSSPSFGLPLSLCLIAYALHRTRLHPSVTFAALYLLVRPPSLGLSLSLCLIAYTLHRTLHPSVTFAALYLLVRLPSLGLLSLSVSSLRLSTALVSTPSVTFAALYLLTRPLPRSPSLSLPLPAPSFLQSVPRPASLSLALPLPRSPSPGFPLFPASMSPAPGLSILPQPPSSPLISLFCPRSPSPLLLPFLSLTLSLHQRQRWGTGGRDISQPPVPQRRFLPLPASFCGLTSPSLSLSWPPSPPDFPTSTSLEWQTVPAPVTHSSNPNPSSSSIIHHSRHIPLLAS